MTAPVLEPVLTLSGGPAAEDCDRRTLLPKLRQLEEEDPQLRFTWDQPVGRSMVQLMGRDPGWRFCNSLVSERFGAGGRPRPGAASCIRRPSPAPVEGVGHFEPLRHYAEVHLLLEPAAPGQRRGQLATRLRRGPAGPELAAADSDPSCRRRATWACSPAPPITDVKHHPDVRPGPCEAHRGGRLPPGHLSGGAPGADAGAESVLLEPCVRLPAGGAAGAAGPGHQRCAPAQRQLSTPPEESGDLTLLRGPGAGDGA